MAEHFKKKRTHQNRISYYTMFMSSLQLTDRATKTAVNSFCSLKGMQNSDSISDVQ